jgi:hypothetical protein
MLNSKHSFKFISRKKITALKDENVVLAVAEPVLDTKKEKNAVDANRRMFLKIAGITGLGVAASAFFPKQANAYVAGSTPTSNVVGAKDASNVRINPAKEDGNLATIKTNTDPFVASGAGGYIRQDSTDTIAKETGGNLATIATNIPAKGQAVMAGSTPVVIASDQAAIPVTGSFSIASVGINDSKDNRINPAQDDSVILLRRIVKLMESQAVVDSGNRQRITLDSIGTNTAVTTTVPVSGTVTATVAGATLAAGSATIGSVLIAGQNQQMFQDVARNTYANGIRQNLIFS